MARTDKITKVSVQLTGLTPIMFDRYAGDNTTKLSPLDKLYRNARSELVMPSRNIQSFLSAQNTRSAARDYYDKREYRTKALAILGFTVVEPFEIPFMRGSKPIVVKEIGDADTYVDKAVARLKDGIPNPKERPVLPNPWALEFTLSIYPNDSVDAVELKGLFEKCCFSIGLGTYRGVYGKCSVTKWDF